MGIATFKAENAQDDILPIWWVEIAGLRLRYSSSSPTWNVADTSTSRTLYPYLSDLINVKAQSVEPLNGKTTSHGLTFSLVDVNDNITALMSVFDETDKNWTWITSDCTAAATKLTVSATSTFTTPCDLYIEGETVRATSKTATTLTITRAMYGSIADDHLATDDAGNAQTIEVWDAPRYIVGRGVTLCESRVGLAEADTAKLYGIISGVTEDDGIWTFQATGILSKLSKIINQNPPKAKVIFTTINSVVVDDASQFVDPPVTDGWPEFRHFRASTTAEWGEGAINYTSVDLMADGTYRLKTFMDGRLIEPESTITQIYDTLMFRDGTIQYTDPLSVLLCLMLSKKGDKTNHATYDILPNKFGLGLDPNLIDVAGIENLRDTTYLKDVKLSFTIPESTDIKKWIEEQILRPNLLFLVETWDGTAAGIKVKRLLTRNEAIIEGPALDITEDMLLELPQLDVSTMPIGEIKWKYGYNDIKDEFSSEVTVVFQESIARYESPRRYELEIKTLPKGFVGRDSGKLTIKASEYPLLPTMLGAYICAIWDRFAVNPLPELSIEIPYNRLTNCYPGSIVRVTCTVTPDLSGSDRGIVAEYFQIVESGPNPVDSSLRLKLWQVGVHDVRTSRYAPSAKIKSIHDDYSGAGKARILIYKNVYAQSTGVDDREKFIAGDKVRFFSSLYVMADSATYTVQSSGTTGTYSYIQLSELEVNNKPATEDGAIMDTASYDSASATQQDYWCFQCDSSNKLGSGNIEGNQRS